MRSRGITCTYVPLLMPVMGPASLLIHPLAPDGSIRTILAYCALAWGITAVSSQVRTEDLRARLIS